MVNDHIPFRLSLTYKSEGSDDPSKPLYYTRIPHRPTGNSGVTFGRGYDLGQKQRAEAEDDLVRIGLTSEQRTLLLDAVGKKGEDAQAYFDANETALEDIELTRRQQYVLFAEAATWEYREAVRLYNRWVDTAKTLPWEELDRRIQRVFVDLKYRGDNRSESREFLAGSMLANDVDAFCRKMKDKAFWRKPPFNVPDDRFKNRSRYLINDGATCP